MKEPIISIIVPVYNVEKYLEDCLASILAQTYQNYEVILVDDGSTDNSSKLCDEYAEKDNRIKVFHKKNGGLSDARNFGIKKSSGEYLTFVDSDDTITSDALEYLFSLIKKYHTKMAIASHKMVTSKKTIDFSAGYENKVITKREALSRLLQERGYAVSAWAKLYRTDLFKNIKYPKGKLYEDNGTTYKLILKCNKIAYGAHAIYNYYRHTGSITTTHFTPDKLSYITLSDQMCSDILKIYPDLEIPAENKRIDVRFHILSQLFNLKNPSPSEQAMKQELLDFLKSHRQNILKNKSVNHHTRFAMLIFCINPSFYHHVWKLYQKVRG